MALTKLPSSFKLISAVWSQQVYRVHRYPFLSASNMSEPVSSGYHQATRTSVRDAQGENVKVIDFRSDTVTKPDLEMRQAMMNADVGDDVYREDPTINELEAKAAKLLGKEASLFVPSGTMSNLIALLIHCKTRGCEVIVGDEAHILHYEQTGASQFGGISLRAVRTLPNGSLDLNEIKQKIRDSSDPHHSITTLICVENTHNRRGGRIVPLNWIKELHGFATGMKLKLHLDGARIFNAAVALGIPASEIASYFDSVSVCLSKGLGAPVGSLLLGSKSFIAEALRCRKALGGGMRQAGILAAAGLLALEKGPGRMVNDHARTKQLARVIQNCGRGMFTVDMDAVETNMLMIQVSPDSGCTPAILVNRLTKSTEKEIEALGHDIRILSYAMTSTRVRIVVHRDINDEHIEQAEKKLRYVIEELCNAKENGA